MLPKQTVGSALDTNSIYVVARQTSGPWQSLSSGILMQLMKTTDYFDNFASAKHPEVQRKWIEQVLASPVQEEVQANGRVSFWGFIPEFGGRALRVITLEDRETVFNAFFDRSFLRRYQRRNQA